MVSKSSSKLECRETIIRNFKSEWTEDLNLKISWTNEINSKDIFFDKYQLIATSPTATYQKVLHGVIYTLGCTLLSANEKVH